MSKRERETVKDWRERGMEGWMKGGMEGVREGVREQTGAKLVNKWDRC